VHPADIQDRDGGILLLATLFGIHPFLEKLFADSAYAGHVFDHALLQILPQLTAKIVKRSDRANGFVVLPKRWIPGSSPRTERSIAWLTRGNRKLRYRGIAKNNHWLHHRAAALNLRKLITLGLAHDGTAWAIS